MSLLHSLKSIETPVEKLDSVCTFRLNGLFFWKVKVSVVLQWTKVVRGGGGAVFRGAVLASLWQK